MIGLTAKDLLSLHEVVREIYPETVSMGKVDHNKLASIAEKPLMEVYGHIIHGTVFKQAACIMEGIIRLHPFPDGNKRTALLATHVYFANNEYYMIVPLDAVRFMVEVARSEASTDSEINELINKIAAWLEERTATNSQESHTILRKYVTYPMWKLALLSLTGVGLVYVNRKIKQWFASDTHPEYAKNLPQTIKFLLSMSLYSIRMSKKRNR